MYLNIPVSDKICIEINQLSSIITQCNLSSIITIINELARHGTKIFSSAWLEMIHIRRASITMVLAVELRARHFEGPQQDRVCTAGRAVV
jgi:hypothetical protein